VSEAADNCWLEISENLQNSAGPPFTRIWYNLDLAEIYDLQWAPDSAYFVAGAINCKGQVVRIKTKETTTLVGHTSYVQGVAWDPLNKMVATQSADNSVKVHQLKTCANGVRLAAQGHTVVRTMSAIESDATAVIDSENAAKPRSLYADSVLVASFFRRLCFTPDGSLLITPTGVLKPSLLKAMSPDLAGKSTSSGVFATHVFHRSNLSVPAVSLGGLDEPSVAVRCSPRLFSRAPQQHSAPAQGFSGDYRVVFAVATTSCVLIYDTQHLAAPLMKISNLHLATINDVAWSADGNVLDYALYVLCVVTMHSLLFFCSVAAGGLQH
jgi:chromatin assembly factor 1 subunit B